MKPIVWVNGGGAVGRVVALGSRSPQFESQYCPITIGNFSHKNMRAPCCGCGLAVRKNDS